ncbi:MAG TPA: transporter [Spirochaetia bacterium]
MEKDVFSRIETYDVALGQRTVLKELRGRVESPAWTPDGKSLVYVAAGNLYLFDLGTKKSFQIHTGDCTSCNAAHVVSPDGKTLAISSGCNESKVSRVWVLPIGGGWPRMITEKYPSHVHGWSPDGTRLAIHAVWGGKSKICLVGVREGSAEVALTDGTDECDAPELSPDGRSLWYHSTRSGRAQLWRMKADGSGQTQITFDQEWNSAFPHVSPDGRRVVFLAFPGDTTGARCEARLMDSEGGSTKTLFELRAGAQGMTVNPWSPDGGRFAFVSYRDGEEVGSL